jgi:taurine transport system substrate-binding protein
MRKYMPFAAITHISRNLFWAVFLMSWVQLAIAQTKEVTIGYQEYPMLMKALVDSPELEAATGYKVKWKAYDTGADVAKALTAGDIQIGELGSSPMTNAMTNGSAIQLFWIAGAITESEALVVKKDKNIKTWADLTGKTVAVPNLSTTHYQLFAKLATERRARDVTVKTMPPKQIRAAWDAATIDAAFIWDPVLNHVKATGDVLITAGDIAKSGFPTFDALAVSAAWGEKNEAFMVGFVQALNRVTKDYSTNSAKWNTNTPIVQTIAKWAKTPPPEILPSLVQMKFLSSEDQLLANWLGGGAARTMADTALFVGIMNNSKITLSSYAPFVNTNYIKKAIASTKTAR